MTKLLTVRLDEGTCNVEDISEMENACLGGVGVNTRLLFDLVPPGADPLGPENVLVFGAGPLVGTLLPTACRSEASAKSPLSGRFGTSNSGGSFGPYLRYAGFSYLAVTGRSDEPVLLVIEDGSARLEKAGELWGLDVWETTDRIKEKLGGGCRVLAIGPAGENMVRFASIQNDYYASFGRTGLGAVMGSKNLKAIAVIGTGAVDVADRKAFRSLYREALQKVKAEPSFGFIRRYGSMVVSDPFDATESLPGRNFTVASLPGWEKTRGRKAFESRYKVGDVACFACPIACAHRSRVLDAGPFRGMETRGLEVTFVMEFGAKLDLESIPEIFACVEICNRQGMDVVSAAGVAAFAIEAMEKGLVKKADVGYTLHWGDYHGISRLLKDMAQKRGFGSLLAEGTLRASAMLPGTAPLAMHIRGVEIPVKDPRAKCDTFTFGYLTNTRGGDSLRGRSPVEAVLQKMVDYQTEPLGVDPEHIRTLDMPERLKNEIFSEKGINLPRMVCYAEDLITIINSAGLCIRPPVLRSLGPDFLARALTAVTGRPYDEDSVLAAAAKTWHLQRQFNQREGETDDEIRFPERFYTESVPGKGGNPVPPLDKAQVEENLREYYLYRNRQN